MTSLAIRPLAILVATAISTTSFAQGLTDYKLGEGGGPVSGAAGGQGAVDASKQLERCERPLGTVAVVEPQDDVASLTQRLARFNLPSPNGMIRLMIQQSNCFQVVERGKAMQNLMQERRLSEGGEFQSGANVGRGQMVQADFLLTPDVNFSENNAGGIAGAAGALGSFFGVGGMIASAVVGGLKFKQAQTTMLLADARSGIQVAAATGSAEKADFGLGGVLGGAGAIAGLGAYENTNEGKIVAASFLDNFNNVVRTIRNNPSLVQAKATPASAANAASSARAGASFNPGDVVVPKIGGIKVFAAASTKSKVVMTLSKADEMLIDGPEVDGMVAVETATGKGFVEVTKIRK